jgi:hypothetical protein
MSDSYGALCTDHYVNVKLGLKLELTRSRETVLALFERVRRQYPGMCEFRKYADELALESPAGDSPHRWLAVRASSVRAGVVNPSGRADAYRLHETALDVSPYFLDISPLDVDYLEVLWGFDLAAGGNHDAIVAETLLAGSPLAGLLDLADGRAADCQPVLGLQLGDGVEAFFEVRTRPEASRGERSSEPISIYVTLRRAGPVDELKELRPLFRSMVERGEDLVERGALPVLVNPLRNAIVPGL